MYSNTIFVTLHEHISKMSTIIRFGAFKGTNKRRYTSFKAWLMEIS